MFRVIGDKLNKLEGKNSAFKEHLHELEADYKRVSGHFDDILASHEKTFLSVRRSIEQGCINQQLILNSLRHTYLRAEVTLDMLHLSDAFSYFYILNIRIDFIYTNEHKDLNLQAKLATKIKWDSIYNLFYPTIPTEIDIQIDILAVFTHPWRWSVGREAAGRVRTEDAAPDQTPPAPGSAVNEPSRRFTVPGRWPFSILKGPSGNCENFVDLRLQLQASASAEDGDRQPPAPQPRLQGGDEPRAAKFRVGQVQVSGDTDIRYLQWYLEYYPPCPADDGNCSQNESPECHGGTHHTSHWLTLTSCKCDIISLIIASLIMRMCHVVMSYIT